MLLGGRSARQVHPVDLLVRIMNNLGVFLEVFLVGIDIGRLGVGSISRGSSAFFCLQRSMGMNFHWCFFV